MRMNNDKKMFKSAISAIVLGLGGYLVEPEVGYIIWGILVSLVGLIWWADWVTD